MNHDFELKLQAWLDGEMSSDEAASFKKTMQSDPQAQDLLGELTAIKTAMTGNELSVKVPETREFYWSKIEREITREIPATAHARSSFLSTLFAQWQRLLVPLAGTVAIVTLLVFSVKQSPKTSLFSEITFTSSDMETVTFHDQSSKMTVVWLQPKDNSSDDETDDSVDPVDVP